MGIECLGVFIKLIEESRRHRVLRLDLGDESARLVVQTLQPAHADKSYVKGSGKGWHEHKGWQWQSAEQKGFKAKGKGAWHDRRQPHWSKTDAGHNEKGYDKGSFV